MTWIVSRPSFFFTRTEVISFLKCHTRLIVQLTIRINTLQTHPVNSTLKRRGNDRFHVVSTWNPRGVFVGHVVALA